MATLISDEELSKLIMTCPDENEPYPDPQTMVNRDGTCKYAYVTLVMLGDLYIAGAIVLAHSIRKCGSSVDLVVLVTPDVSEEGKNVLRTYFTHVIEVKYVTVPNWRTKKQQHRKYLELVFTKFHVFNLVQYEKILLIDADALVLKYPDHLFTLNAPAGCFLEDKDLIISYDKEGNYVLPSSGKFEWYNKYCECCRHGNSIPKELTDRVKNDQKNSGIGGGLLLLEPKKGEFESILNDVVRHPMKYLIENKFVWPEQQYLTLRYSGKWTSINPRFFGLQGYPHWKILYGLQYGGEKPFVVKSKFDIKIRIQYPDFVLWHQYYAEMLEEHPEFLSLSSLSQANEMNKFFYSSIKFQKGMISRMEKSDKNVKSIIRKVYKINDNIKINDNQIRFFHMSRDTEYNNARLGLMWDDIKEYDYLEPIKRLSSYYGDTSYYNKILKIYSDSYAGKVGRLDEQFPIDFIDPIDRDLIMLEYIKCRKNLCIFTFWPTIIQKITNDKLINILQKYGNVCYAKTLTLSKKGLFNLMFWTYREMTFSSRIDFIEKNMERLQFAEDNEITIVFVDKTTDMSYDNLIQELLNETKFKIDDTIKVTDLIYLNDLFYNIIEYGKIILNDNSIRLLEIQDVHNIINSHFVEANLKLQTFRKWCNENLSLMESERILIHGEAILYSLGFRNINDIDSYFISINNDDSQSEKELKELLNINFNEKNTKFSFVNMKIEKSEYWNNKWDNELNEVLSYFDMDDLLEITMDPRHHYYFDGMKYMLYQHEIIRKIYSNTDKDKADFIMLATLHPGMTSQYVQLHNEKLEIKTTNATEVLSHEHLKKLFKFIFNKYPRKDIQRLKKLLNNVG